MIVDQLYAQLEQQGLKGRVVSIRHLHELEQDIKGRQSQNLFDSNFYRERLDFFEFHTPDELFSSLSLIIVAMPRPQTRVTFTWSGKTLSLILPPTYWKYQRISSHIMDRLKKILAPEGYHVTLANLPLKTLAVRSRLGAYGRNNICYVPGMGSFLQLAACYSDFPCAEDDWQAPTMMDRCQKCLACLRKCPTQAITSERFLLHAERCIVFHNERGISRTLPDWLDLSSHDCLFGCMVCQRFCPEDTRFLGWFEGNEEFNQEETNWFLQGFTNGQLPYATVEKLERLELSEDLEVLSRNLKVLFHVNK